MGLGVSRFPASRPQVKQAWISCRICKKQTIYITVTNHLAIHSPSIYLLPHSNPSKYPLSICASIHLFFNLPISLSIFTYLTQPANHPSVLASLTPFIHVSSIYSTFNSPTHPTIHSFNSTTISCAPAL